MGVHRTCREPNEIDLAAINPLLNGSLRYCDEVARRTGKLVKVVSVVSRSI